MTDRIRLGIGRCGFCGGCLLVTRTTTHAELEPDNPIALAAGTTLVPLCHVCAVETEAELIASGVDYYDERKMET